MALQGRCVFRRGVPGDELCVGVLAMQVFLDTYATSGIRPDLAREALDVYAPARCAERLGDPHVEMTLAEVDEHLVAFADVSSDSACPIAGIAGPEVLRLYVQRPFQRRGLGRALLAQAEAAARARGAAFIWLTAWVGNAAALAFYPRVGYRDVGSTVYVIEGRGYENRVYAKPLDYGLFAPASEV